MGKKKVELPSAPEFFEDPNFSRGTGSLLDLGERLTSFDFSGDLAPLQEAIDLDPEITRLALEQAQGTLTPAFDLQRQNTVNRLANLGALESSTTSDALAQIDTDLLSQLQGITAGAALEDRNRALQNRVNLFGAGLDATSQGTSFAGTNQSNRNTFNQQQFENQLALAQLNQDDKGGLFGGLLGAAGGAAAGVALAPFTGGLSLLTVGGLAGAGGALGALGPSGTGGQILGAGTSALGYANPQTFAGKTAGIDLASSSSLLSDKNPFVRNAFLNDPFLADGFGLN